MKVPSLPQISGVGDPASAYGPWESIENQYLNNLPLAHKGETGSW